MGTRPGFRDRTEGENEGGVVGERQAGTQAGGEQRAGVAVGLGKWAVAGRALEPTPASARNLRGPRGSSPPGRTPVHGAVMGRRQHGAGRACFQSWWAAPTPRTAGSTLPRSEAQPGLSLRPPGPGAGPSLRVPSPPPPQGLTPSLRGQGGVRVCLEECMKWGEGRDTHGSLGCAPSSSAISGDS